MFILLNLKAQQQIPKKQCFGKFCSCDKAIFILIGHVLTALFGKTGN